MRERIGDVIWAGVPLSSVCDVIIEKPPASNRPKRKVDRYKVPGRNGDVIIQQDAWENVTRSYKLAIHDSDGPEAIFHGFNYDGAASALMEWLYSPSGYQRLEDTFDEQVYRKAYVSEETKIDNLMNSDGFCSIEFECDPRRFLKGGDALIALSSELTLTNPTKFTALPLIYLDMQANSSLSLNGSVMLQFDSAGKYYISSEYETITDDNGSPVFNLARGKFPKLYQGESVIETSGMNSGWIIPNWWTI